jgi:hypothetical protein
MLVRTKQCSARDTPEALSRVKTAWLGVYKPQSDRLGSVSPVVRSGLGSSTDTALRRMGWPARIPALTPRAAEKRYAGSTPGSPCSPGWPEPLDCTSLSYKSPFCHRLAAGPTLAPGARRPAVLSGGLTLSLRLKRPLSARLSHRAAPTERVLIVKGFGCRPIRGVSAGTEGRRPKASREGTRGGRREGCRLWRFDRRAAPASDARVGGTDRG